MRFDGRYGLPSDSGFSGKLTLGKTVSEAEIFQMILKMFDGFRFMCLSHAKRLAFIIANSNNKVLLRLNY